MSEIRKTLLFCGVAVVLAGLSLLTAPRRVTPEAFSDQGEAFFPGFTDPNAARTLEVIGFDDETGAASPFKVTYAGGIWTIPSHHNYPADAKDRLARTAAGIIELKKDDFRTDNVSDHAACGVVDPLEDASAGLKGRGQRVTIKGESDAVLADLIVGAPVEGRDKMRFVRIPGQKRVYASRMDMEVSTNFGDWIEKDLLQAGRDDVDNIVLRNYSVDERSGKVDEKDRIVLEKQADWTTPGLKKDEEIVAAKLDDLLGALDELKIEGVRPKPEGLSASLTRASQNVSITTEEVLSLQSMGYFFSRDGRLLSNEGEVQARTKDGLTYTLRFGEVVYGSGIAVTAGTSGEGEGALGRGENRYLFVTVTFDGALFPEPRNAPNTDFLAKPDSLWTDADRENRGLYDAYRDWTNRVSGAQKRAAELNARFAKWYYVISSSSFEKLRPARIDLIKKKES
jgi:hypothetical protein